MTGTAVQPPPSTILAESDPLHGSTAPPSRSLLAWLQRPLVACLVLLAVYATCTLALNDPRGTLGTDTGGKLATLHVMDHNGSLVPEIGYWAASADPKGDLHPIFYTFKVDGKWVNVTTLPMVYAAYPLFELGGDRGVLLLPMLGSILCALAARALARRLGRGSGWSAFWVMGLLSPVAIYALDFWEHSLGLALMLWGVVWLLRLLDDEHGLRAALVAGALFGARPPCGPRRSCTSSCAAPPRPWCTSGDRARGRGHGAPWRCAPRRCRTPARRKRGARTGRARRHDPGQPRRRYRSRCRRVSDGSCPGGVHDARRHEPVHADG